MANLRYPGFTPPPPNASRWEKVLWQLFNSPQAQASGMAVPTGGASSASRIAAAYVARQARQNNPGLIKWVMDRAGNITFGHAGQYHEELMSSGRWAGGVIDNGRVQIFRDLGKAGEGAFNSIRQSVARKWVEEGKELFGAVGVAAVAQRQSSPQTAQMADSVRMLGDITGLDGQTVRNRLRVLARSVQNLAPEDHREWFSGLNLMDKAFMLAIMPGQPLLREIWVARQAIPKEDWYKSFVARPENQKWFEQHMIHGERRGTPEQLAFLDQIDRRAREMVSTGQARTIFEGQSVWAQIQDDMIASTPYMLVPGWLPLRAFNTLTSHVVRKGASVLTKIGAPAARVINRVVGPFLRESVKHNTELLSKSMDALDKYGVQITAEVGEAGWRRIRAQAQNSLQAFLKDWADPVQGRKMAQIVADSEAATWIRNVKSKLGVSDMHFHVVQKMRAEQDILWEESSHIAQASGKRIEDLRTQAQAPGLSFQQVQALTQQMRQETARMNQEITTRWRRIVQIRQDPAGAGKALGYNLSPDDARKVTGLYGEVHTRMRGLLPATHPDFRPYYYPDFKPTPDRLIQRLRDHPSSFDPSERQRFGAGQAATAEDAVRAIHQRISIDTFAQYEGARQAAYEAWIKNVADQFTPALRDSLKGRLKAIEGITPQQIDGISGWLMGKWRDAVLVGRLVPWMSINALGNMTNMANEMIQSWTTPGRLPLNPLDIFKRMNIPLHALEVVGERSSLDPTGSVFARLRQKLYDTNSVVEVLFRGASFKMEGQAAWRALQADIRAGRITTQTARQLADQVGWQNVNKTYYNYADRFLNDAIARNLIPFGHFRVENYSYWMRAIYQQPWLIPQFARLAEERPELKIPVGRLFEFFKEMGIDERAVDLIGKMNWIDLFSGTGLEDPKFIRDNKQKLGTRLAQVMTKYKDDPNGLDAFLAADPDLKLYKEYVERSVLKRLVGHAMGVVQPGPIASAVAAYFGVTPDVPIRGQAGKRRPIVPQEMFLRDAVAGIGRSLGIKGLENLLVEPEPTQVMTEMRRLLIADSRTNNRPMLDPEKMDDRTYQEWVTKARENIIARRFADRAADLFSPLGGGNFTLQFQQELWDTLAQNPQWVEGVRLGRFPPPPDDIRTFTHKYGLNHEDAIVMARRAYARRIDKSTAPERRARFAAFEAAPQELQNLMSVANPTERPMYQRIKKAVDAYFAIQNPVDRREFLNAGTYESKLVKAYLASRYTDEESSVVDEVGGMSNRERQRWYTEKMQTDPERARMFADLFPEDAERARLLSVTGQDAPPEVASPTGGTPAQPPVMMTRSEPPAEIAKGLVAAGVPADVARNIAAATSPSPQALVRPVMFDGTSARPSEAFTRRLLNSEGRRVTKDGLHHAYRDPGGTWTIGHGHTGSVVKKKIAALKAQGFTDDQIEKQQLATVTSDEATAIFQADLGRHAGYVRGHLKAAGVSVTQNQFDALVDAAYNAGPEVARRSIVRLAKGDVQGAAQALRVHTAKGVVLQGLVTRSDARVKLFTTPDSTPVAAHADPTPRGSQGVTPTYTGTSGTDLSRVAEDLRDGYRVVGENGTIVYKGNIGEAMVSYILAVNPKLDRKEAAKIKDAVMSRYSSANTDRNLWHRFDPLWLVGIIAARTKFDPEFKAKGRLGIAGLSHSEAANFGAEDFASTTKSVEALTDLFLQLQGEVGTVKALEALGVKVEDVYRFSAQVIGLRPVAYVVPQPGARRPIMVDPETPAMNQAAQLITKLWLARRNPEDTDYAARSRQEMSDAFKAATPEALEILKARVPDLFFQAQVAASGQATWWTGRIRPEQQTTEYLAFKHKILLAQSVDEAARIFNAAPPHLREQFSLANGDMFRFFVDKNAGIVRDYTKYEFSDSTDPKFLDAKQKLAQAMGTGNPELVRKAMKEIRSIYDDDVSNFSRLLKNDSPAMFAALKPFMETPVYGPDEKLRVRALQTAIEEKLRDVRAGRVEALREAAALWLDPENAGVLELAREHETAWFDRTFRLLDGETPADSFIRPEEHIPFHRFLNSMQDARESKDSEALRRAWQSAPAHFQEEYKLHHAGRYANDEAIINGEDPQAWTELKRKRLYEPYLDYLQMNDQYGSFSPEKLEMIMKESPAAAAYLLENGEVMGRVTAGIRARQAALYTSVLRQYQYNPALLNAIPDDGTRYLISLTDPNAKAAFEQYRIPVTQVEFPRVKGIRELYGEQATTSEEVDAETGQKTGRVIITNTAGLPGYGAGVTSIAVSAADLARQQGALLKLNPESPEFKRLQTQFRTHQGIVQGLGLVYQGIQIGQRGGGFLEQLPSFFGAAQTAAQAGLFTGPAAGFLLGPTGLLVGGALGILGNIFGANRQAEEERRRRNEQIQQQLAAESEQLRERLRSLDRRQLVDVEARTGAVSKFLEQPTAITRQALLEVLSVPRPTW